MAPGHEHGATGDTHRAAEGAGAVVAPEAETLLAELVEIGCLDVWVAVGSYRVCSLVVGEKEDDVGTIGGVGCRQQERRDEKGSEHSLANHCWPENPGRQESRLSLMSAFALDLRRRALADSVGFEADLTEFLEVRNVASVEEECGLGHAVVDLCEVLLGESVPFGQNGDCVGA